LDHLGVIKLVDFGAAKILARNHRTMMRSRRPAEGLFGGGLGIALSSRLTGTPMYMSPEVIKNDTRGRHGAMDIWSMGCVVLEFATGKKPWSHLDNEWYVMHPRRPETLAYLLRGGTTRTIMYHIGVATQHPPLPEHDQLSGIGINFIKECLTVDPTTRLTAFELMDHPWMLDFRKALQTYDETEMSKSPPAEMPSEEAYESATVARQAAIIQEKEVEAIKCISPDPLPVESSLLDAQVYEASDSNMRSTD
jgi:mitogen-activated protein kinase kinase kinase